MTDMTTSVSNYTTSPSSVSKIETCDNQGSDLLRGKRKDPQIGQLAHASHGVFRPKIVLPSASDAATGLVFQSTFGSFLSLRLQVEIY